MFLLLLYILYLMDGIFPNTKKKIIYLYVLLYRTLIIFRFQIFFFSLI